MGWFRKMKLVDEGRRQKAEGIKLILEDFYL
jgi:hypothetical protein